MTASGVAVKRLHHVSLSTSNLASQVAFYCDVLGGTVAHEFRNDTNELYGVFVYFGNGSFIEIFNDPGVARVEKPAFRHLALEVDDINAAAQFLRSKGYRPKVKRGRTDQVLQCFIEDADGNIVELQQHDEKSALSRFLRDFNKQ